MEKLPFGGELDLPRQGRPEGCGDVECRHENATLVGFAAYVRPGELVEDERVEREPCSHRPHAGALRVDGHGMGGESGIRNRSLVGTGEQSRVLHPPRHSGLGGGGDLEGVDVVGESDKEGGRLVDRSPPGQQGGVGDKDAGHQQTG